MTETGSDDRWNVAIDWLLSSRYTADPDVQTMFWAIVDGHHPREGIETADLTKLRLIMDV